MRLEHDSLRPAYKQPFGALTAGQPCRVCLLVREAEAEVRAELVLQRDGGSREAYPMTAAPEPEGLWFSARLTLPDCGLYFYHFQVRCGQEETTFQSGAEPWQLTVCPSASGSEAAWAGKTAYQIFPDRFCRVGTPDLGDKLQPYTLRDAFEAPAGEAGLRQLGNSDFYGGNFAGIEEKLPYLQSLGVQVLYLNPICMAQSSHRYDTADYLRPDPMLGSVEDFCRLCQAVHARGMRLILDGVFSHTGSISRYFDQDGRFGGGAASDPDSPYRSWYSFQHWPDQYTTWWGMPTLPCLNELEPSVLEFLVTGPDSVIRHWLRLGADGFRLDVADELPDEFLRALHQAVHEEKQDGIVVGEVWEDASNKVSYDRRRTYFTAPELDGVINYPWRSVIIDLLLGNCTAPEAARRVLTLADHYPARALNQCLVSLSTHDTPRILTVFLETQSPDCPCSLERARALEQTAAVLQFFLPGMPCIYYGDEAGMEGGPDPDNRRPYPWGREDRELIGFYRTLAGLRQQERALQIGALQAGAYSDRLLWVRRQCSDDTLTLLLNTGAETLTLPCHGRTVLLHRCRPEGQALLLSSYGAAILKENSSSRE